jgi:hypothetical protein
MIIAGFGTRRPQTVPATYSPSASVPIRRPTLRCAAASCPQASAVRSSQSRPFGHSVARRYREHAASVTAVHASDAENGMARGIFDPDSPSANDRPPAVEAGRETPSPRRNQYNPTPARMGCNTIIKRIAREQEKSENNAIGGRYIHPDCGSAAKGTPAMTCGFQAGIWPCVKLSPR